MSHVEKIIEVNAPVSDCFDMWACLSCLSTFLTYVDSGRFADNQFIWHWKVVGPANHGIEWDTVVDTMEENKVITWHSAPGAVADTSGAVSFEKISDYKTRVHVEMMFNPPAKAAGEFVADVFTKNIDQRIEEDLKTFKQLVERPEKEYSHVPLAEDFPGEADYIRPKNITPTSVRTHGRTHEIRNEPAV